MLFSRNLSILLLDVFRSDRSGNAIRRSHLYLCDLLTQTRRWSIAGIAHFAQQRKMPACSVIAALTRFLPEIIGSSSKIRDNRGFVKLRYEQVLWRFQKKRNCTIEFSRTRCRNIVKIWYKRKHRSFSFVARYFLFFSNWTMYNGQKAIDTCLELLWDLLPFRIWMSTSKFARFMVPRKKNYGSTKNSSRYSRGVDLL